MNLQNIHVTFNRATTVCIYMHDYMYNYIYNPYSARDGLILFAGMFTAQFQVLDDHEIVIVLRTQNNVLTERFGDSSHLFA